jgi:hypothetical protein
LKSFLRYFPQIDTVNPPPGSSASHAATIQAITGKFQDLYQAAKLALIHTQSRRIHARMLLRCRGHYLARKHSGA